MEFNNKKITLKIHSYQPHKKKASAYRTRICTFKWNPRLYFEVYSFLNRSKCDSAIVNETIYTYKKNGCRPLGSDRARARQSREHHRSTIKDTHANASHTHSTCCLTNSNKTISAVYPYVNTRVKDLTNIYSRGAYCILDGCICTIPVGAYCRDELLRRLRPPVATIKPHDCIFGVPREFSALNNMYVHIHSYGHRYTLSFA